MVDHWRGVSGGARAGQAIDFRHPFTDELGLRIPDDISVIGLDDSIKPPEHLPALTSVGFPHGKVGRLAVEVLLQRIGDERLYYSKIFVRSSLIERDSCGRPRS